MSEPQPEQRLSPREEQLRHEASILATLPPPTYHNIPAGKLRLLDYVNDLEGASPSRVNLYRDTWAPAIVGVPVVHKERNSYAIIDGRHRFLASRLMRPAPMFHCAVHENLAQEQVVALYLFHNQHRRNPSVSEKYHAAVASGDPIATCVSRVLSTRGVSGELKAYTAALAVVKEGSTILDGGQALDFAIRVLTAAFPATDTARLESTLVRPVGRFFRVHGGNPKLKEERFVGVLSNKGKRSASQLKGLGVSNKESRSGTNSAAAAIFRILEQEYAQASGGNWL